MLERKALLDYFVRRCGQLKHIYYSHEMQTFLRASDDAFKKEFGTKRTIQPADVYAKYKDIFVKEADMEINDEVWASVDKYFESLKRTVEFFSSFVRIGKWFNTLKKKNTLDYLTFIKYALGDFKRTLTVEGQESLLLKYDKFVK